MTRKQIPTLARTACTIRDRRVISSGTNLNFPPRLIPGKLNHVPRLVRRISQLLSRLRWALIYIESFKLRPTAPGGCWYPMTFCQWSDNSIPTLLYLSLVIDRQRISSALLRPVGRMHLWHTIADYIKYPSFLLRKFTFQCCEYTLSALMRLMRVWNQCMN